MENRVIKFRAWDGDKIIYQSEDGWFDKVKHPEYQSPQCMQFHSIAQVCEIMQYTGLTDKNGVEIYEGDVMCWPQYEGTKNQTRWVVSYNPLKGFCSWSPVEEAVVIGNLFENPELLNP